MNMRIFVLSFPLLLLIFKIVQTTTSQSYYLLDVDLSSNNNETETVLCSNLQISQTYRIPRQCLKHFYCDPVYCDDKQFRCVKVRESLCCLHKYFLNNCQQNRDEIKEQFRLIYFQISLLHPYCEINLERIEKNDDTYCIAVDDRELSTTTMTIPSPIRIYRPYHHRNRHLKPSFYNPTATSNYFNYKQKYKPAARHNNSNTHYLRKITFNDPTVNNLNRFYHNSNLMFFLIIFTTIMSIHRG